MQRDYEIDVTPASRSRHILLVAIDVPGFDHKVRVDIAYGGMWYCLVDAASVGLTIESANGRELVDVGERIKRAVAGLKWA